MIETIRINRVVKELNIGIGTLVEFLKKKGIDVDPSPNSKLSTEAYLLAKKEFDKEHLLKEQSKKIIFKIVEPEPVVPVTQPEKPIPPKVEPIIVAKENPPSPPQEVIEEPTVHKEAPAVKIEK